MHKRSMGAALLALLALTALALGGASQAAQSAQPAQTTRLFLPIAIKPGAQPSSVSFWGMNLYLSKRERRNAGDNLGVLADLARGAGVAWTREELPWDLIEPRDDQFSTVYDADLSLAAQKGLGIVGMLLTTPAWARDPACPGNFWCPPANVAEYAEFAGWMVERYDGDGRDDAPGSPRVAYWQIWNEPNDTALWPNVGGGENGRRLRYGQLLVAAYAAIKAADPTAKVLIGGTYIYDGSCAGGVCDGFNFLNAEGGVFKQTPAARQAFDSFAVHPYIPTDQPDSPTIPRVITLEGRLRTARAWLNDPSVGRSDAPIWVTELGWCTAPGTCPGGTGVSEDQQAAYLARSLVIAQHNGVEHLSWFQFEDAFNDPGRVWANAAITRQFDGTTYPAKPAYNAYKTLAAQLAGATPAGVGPLNTHVYDAGNPLGAGGGVYDYRYTRGADLIDVLWSPDTPGAARLPVGPGRSVTLVALSGAVTPLTPINGAVAINIGATPIIVVQTP